MLCEQCRKSVLTCKGRVINYDCSLFSAIRIGDDLKSERLREYEKYEFCFSVNCKALHKIDLVCLADKCEKTAKEFHKWIISKNGKITIPKNEDKE